MNRFIASLILILVANCTVAETTKPDSYSPTFETLSINNQSAAFFSGTSKHAVVFVPGSVFNKESWFFLAERFQKLQIASLSLDGKGKPHVLAAIKYLVGKGFTEISLVGGSVGGSAVLNAVNGNNDPSIVKVIVLAPYGGSPIKQEKISKLFVVAKKDNLGIFSDVQKQYEESSQPKKIQVYSGSKHAQHLFKGPHKKELTDLIIEFVNE